MDLTLLPQGHTPTTCPTPRGRTQTPNVPETARNTNGVVGVGNRSKVEAKKRLHPRTPTRTA